MPGLKNCSRLSYCNYRASPAPERIPTTQTLDLPGFLALTACPCRRLHDCWIANSAGGVLFAFQQTVQ
jgi:hypothetical protein